MKDGLKATIYLHIKDMKQNAFIGIIGNTNSRVGQYLSSNERWKFDSDVWKKPIRDAVFDYTNGELDMNHPNWEIISKALDEMFGKK